MRFFKTVSFKPSYLDVEVFLLNEAPKLRPQPRERASSPVGSKAFGNNERISNYFDRS